jgi:hypothetical protein
LTWPAGAQWPKGDTGAQGVAWPTWPQGATGPTWPQGVQGDTWPQGPKGDKGDTGLAIVSKWFTTDLFEAIFTFWPNYQTDDYVITKSTIYIVRCMLNTTDNTILTLKINWVEETRSLGRAAYSWTFVKILLILNVWDTFNSKMNYNWNSNSFNFWVSVWDLDAEVLDLIDFLNDWNQYIATKPLFILMDTSAVTVNYPSIITDDWFEIVNYINYNQTTPKQNSILLPWWLKYKSKWWIRWIFI